jgi:hypothetical protein
MTSLRKEREDTVAIVVNLSLKDVTIVQDVKDVS